MFEVFKEHGLWFGFILVFIFLYFVFLISMTLPISQYSIEKAGQLGDSFGIVNSLFSGLAFIALVITIYLQQQDTRETKKEAQKQNFENIFFKMIDLYNNVVKDLILIRKKHIYDINPDGTEEYKYNEYEILGVKLYKPEKDYKGKEVLPELLNLFSFYLKLIEIKRIIVKKERTYENFHDEFESNIGHYFGTIYQILNFIDNSKIENKTTYANLFRAQFSKQELELLFYHGTSQIALAKFTPLLIRFEFFEHLSNIEVIHDQAVKKYLDKTKELNIEPIHKVFGNNRKWIEKVKNLSLDKNDLTIV